MNHSGKRIALVIGAAFALALPVSAQSACEIGKAVTREHVSAPKLRYRLVDRFGPVYFCDPECIGPCLLDLEKKHAEEAFPQIRKDSETLQAITERLKLEGISEFSAEQKLLIYREYKTLVCGLSFEADGKKQKFKIESGNGLRVEGLIDLQGKITALEMGTSRLACLK